MKENRHSKLESYLDCVRKRADDFEHETGEWRKNYDDSYSAACSKCGAHLVVGDLPVLDTRLSKPCPGEKPRLTDEQAKLLAKVYSFILSWNNDPDSKKATESE